MDVAVLVMPVMATHVSTPPYDRELGLEARSNVLFADRPGY
jgi:hypothetical protein